MPVFSGNTSGSISQVAANIPSGIESFNIVNKSGGAITLNLYVKDSDNNNVNLLYNLAMDGGDTVISDTFIKLLAGSSIYIVTTGLINYYFSIK